MNYLLNFICNHPYFSIFIGLYLIFLIWLQIVIKKAPIYPDDYDEDIYFNDNDKEDPYYKLMKRKENDRK